MKKNQVKNWSEIKSNDSWALFKIMSEFVEGYETLSAIGPCISIFGSARTQEGDSNYQLTVAIAEAISLSGYGIISGGGPGIMEAANKGAQKAGGRRRAHRRSRSVGQGSGREGTAGPRSVGRGG